MEGSPVNAFPTLAEVSTASTPTASATGEFTEGGVLRLFFCFLEGPPDFLAFFCCIYRTFGKRFRGWLKNIMKQPPKYCPFSSQGQRLWKLMDGLDQSPDFYTNLQTWFVGRFGEKVGRS